MSVGLHASDLTGNLTQLYTETKKSALNNASKDTTDDTAPALTSLHRKFRIQKDRLITWGLEWSDEGKGPDGNIDESIARAGVTETVTSVLENIKEVLEQAERIRSASTPTRSPGWPVLAPEKAPLLAVDIPRYRDLVTDLTTSIDILYDLSRTRRALAAGSHPPFGSDNQRPLSDEKAALFESFASEQTLVAQQSGKSTQARLVGLPPVIDLAALILPEEGPPPYSNTGVPMTTRMVGRLLRAHCPDEVRFALQESFDDPLVLIEYANFDSLYRENQVPPPMARLEALSNYLQQAKIRPQLNIIGYFEDPKESRIGLIFDISECNLDNMAGPLGETGPVETYDLLHLLQSASNKAKSHDTLSATPSLEDRFKLALRVAERVQDLHVNESIHGNLHSGSILFVKVGDQEKSKTGQLRSPILGSFNLFSKVQIEGQANKSVLNIYQHPTDQDRDFNLNSGLKFDAYGLGLTLLEIGLWSPLSELHKAKYNLSDFKMRLERIWIPRLASKCGSLYMKAVEACFSFSDHSQVDQQQALRLYETTLSRLRRCCLLCDETSMVGSPRHSLMSPVAESATGDTQPNTPFTPRPYQSPIQARTDFSRKPVPATPERSSTYPRSQRSVSKLQSSIPSSSDAFGIETIKEGISAAASNLQNAWTDNRGAIQQAWTDNRGLISYPFREYRRRVVVLQNTWRQRQSRRASAADVETPLPAELHRAATAPADVSTAIQSRGITRRPVGAPPKQRAFPVNLPPQQLAEWHTNLGVRLSRIVERALKNSLESSTIDLVGLGTDESNAKPTILVTCTSTAQVKAAIKKRFRCDTNMFDVKVRKGTVSLSRRRGRTTKEGGRTGCRSGNMDSERIRRSQAHSDYETEDEREPQNPYYHPRPSCGASIGAYNTDEGHLLPVSFGGVILVDDKPYGMSVHHMLEPLSDEEDADSIAGSDADDESDAVSASSAFDSEPEEVPDLVVAPPSTDVLRSRVRAPRRSSAKPPRDMPTKAIRSPKSQSQEAPKRSRAKEPVPELPHRSSAKRSMDSVRKPDLVVPPPSNPTRRPRSPSPDFSSSGIDFDSVDDSDLSSDFDSDPEEHVEHKPGLVVSEGDTRAFLPTAPVTSEWRITQPGLLDAQSTGWHLMDQDQMDTDEDHLASFELGRLHASSGLRRYRDAQGLLHEVDWALFTVKQDRHQCNLILGGRRHLKAGQHFRSSITPRSEQQSHQTDKNNYQPKVYSPVLRNPGDDILGTSFGPSSSEDEAGSTAKSTQKAILTQAAQFPPSQDLFPHVIALPSQVASSTGIAGSTVLCSGRTSGLATGRVNPGLSFVKIYGRRTFSSSWTVVGDFGVGGDSGAWVVECEKGGVCGAVLAEKGGVTYFAPMDVLLEDIRLTLKAQSVRLPGPDGEGTTGTGAAGGELVAAQGEEAQSAQAGDVQRSLAMRGKVQELGFVKDRGAYYARRRQAIPS
ncbi:hypothetical protein BDZ85DRAFT_260721 [Elsinoe ampelina]|uniref:Protein kinase domain-containing protein n=1 Tax=Elsinoe ampelina TaxID=302913 RepID=A0A6A6GF17_9PEZI|nr:hypothetical protein BDZ85DRAFT_260721 [Elsinoe ampelina]